MIFLLVSHSFKLKYILNIHFWKQNISIKIFFLTCVYMRFRIKSHQFFMETDFFFLNSLLKFFWKKIIVKEWKWFGNKVNVKNGVVVCVYSINKIKVFNGVVGKTLLALYILHFLFPNEQRLNAVWLKVWRMCIELCVCCVFFNENFTFLRTKQTL